MSQLFVCGDICNSLPRYSSNFISQDIIEIIKSSDYSIINLEGVESNSRNCVFPHQEVGTIGYLKSCGFDMCLLANNHITDGGKGLLQETLTKLDGVDFDYLGAGMTEEMVYSPVIKHIGNYSFGFFNMCEAQVGQYTNKNCDYGYAWLGHPAIVKNICNLRKQVDFIVCLCHFGLEHYETPLSCVRNYYFQLIDIGVDCIIGAHPHIAQGFEYYNNKLIIYSLGNFFFPRESGLFEHENHSYSVLLDFERERQIKLTPIFHELKDGVVQIDRSGTINLDYLNSLLCDNFLMHEETTIRNAFNSLVGDLLYSSVCSMADPRCTLKEQIKNLLRYSIFRSKYVSSTSDARYSTMLRLFNNEIYKYIITEYFKQKKI